MIVVGAVLFPEFSDLGAGPIDQGALNIVLGFGFIFISGFALLPAMIVVADHRGVLCPQRADLCGRRRAGRARLLSRPGSVRPRDAALRGHRPASSRNHDRRGHRRRPGLLDDRRPQCRRLARAAASRCSRRRRCRRIRRRRRRRDDVRTRSAGFHREPSSAKPRAMNRTGLFIALALGARHRIAVRDLSRTRSEARGAVLRSGDQILSAQAQRAGRRSRATARCGSPGPLRCRRSSRWSVKLVRPDRPLLISGRAIVFLLVTLAALRRRSHQSHLQELLGPAAPGGGDAVQRPIWHSCRGGIRAAAARATVRSSPAKAPPRSGPTRPRR